jgi:hypothetical protein
MLKSVAVLTVVALVFPAVLLSDVGPCGVPADPNTPCYTQNPKIEIGDVVNGHREGCITFKCGVSICIQVDASSRDPVTVCACGCCVSFRPCIGLIWPDADECSDMCDIILT